MARHDVHVHGDGYLLVAQADLLDHLNTRIVVPLLPKGQAPTPAARLNPVFTIEGNEVVMVTQFLAAVPIALLGEKVASLMEHHDEIVAALDMAFQGF